MIDNTGWMTLTEFIDTLVKGYSLPVPGNIKDHDRRRQGQDGLHALRGNGHSGIPWSSERPARRRGIEEHAGEKNGGTVE